MNTNAESKTVQTGGSIDGRLGQAKDATVLESTSENWSLLNLIMRDAWCWPQ
jgi:hypothetical protein